MLTLARDSTFADSLRAYSILLDGVNIGTIRDGEIKHFDIKPGMHSLMLRIDWARSQKIEFNFIEGYDAIFLCSSSVNSENVFIRGLQVYYHATLGRSKYISLKQVDRLSDDVLQHTRQSSDQAAPKSKGPMVTKLFYLSLIVAGLVTILSAVVRNDFNPLTHTCISNPSQSAYEYPAGAIAFGREFTNPPQKFCSENHHPQLTENWETIDRYVTYTSYAICFPAALCTGAILLSRLMKKKLSS